MPKTVPGLSVATPESQVEAILALGEEQSSAFRFEGISSTQAAEAGQAAARVHYDRRPDANGTNSNPDGNGIAVRQAREGTACSRFADKSLDVCLRLAIVGRLCRRTTTDRTRVLVRLRARRSAVRRIVRRRGGIRRWRIHRRVAALHAVVGVAIGGIGGAAGAIRLVLVSIGSALVGRSRAGRWRCVGRSTRVSARRRRSAAVGVTRC